MGADSEPPQQLLPPTQHPRRGTCTHGRTRAGTHIAPHCSVRVERRGAARAVSRLAPIILAATRGQVHQLSVARAIRPGRAWQAPCRPGPARPPAGRLPAQGPGAQHPPLRLSPPHPPAAPRSVPNGTGPDPDPPAGRWELARARTEKPGRARAGGRRGARDRRSPGVAVPPGHLSSSSMIQTSEQRTP